MVYLDYAAATPMSLKAKKAAEPYLSELFFNPSSPYLPAKHVREAYESAKNDIAHTIGAKGNNLVITAGATEANNLALTIISPGAYSDPCKSPKIRLAGQNQNPNYSSHEFSDTNNPDSSGRNSSSKNHYAKVLILATEHDSVFKTAQNYNYDIIEVDKTGRIDLNDLKTKLTPSVELVSISLANNELGTIQPLAEVAEIIRAERLRRLENGEKTPLYLHSDASQALNLLSINVSRLGVDMMTLNAAKVYGPKGVGALYISPSVQFSRSHQKFQDWNPQTGANEFCVDRKNDGPKTKNSILASSGGLRPISFGGGQELGLRSGTENVPGVMAFAAAAKDAKEHINSNRKKYENLKRLFKSELSKNLENSKIEFKFLGNSSHQLANLCPISFPGLDAERLIFKLEEKEIYLSTGAACAASKGEKSRTLKAIGLSDSEIAGSLRISFGAGNSEDNIKTAAREISAAAREEHERIKNA